MMYRILLVKKDVEYLGFASMYYLELGIYTSLVITVAPSPDKGELR